MIRWDDWNAERSFMEVATANRRNPLLGGCRQLKDDIASYSERICHNDPIQVEFDFTIELKELDQLRSAADWLFFFHLAVAAALRFQFFVAESPSRACRTGRDHGGRAVRLSAICWLQRCGDLFASALGL